MKKYLTKGSVAGLLALAAAVATVFGKTELATYFQDPQTATAVFTVATGVIGLAAGVLEGIESKPSASSVAPKAD